MNASSSTSPAHVPASPRRARLALAAALGALLAWVGCGGGGGGSASSSGPASPVTVGGTLSGTATAPQFNQQPLQTASARVTVNGQVAASSVLQPGIQFMGRGSRDSQGIKLSSMDVIQELRGPITAINSTAATLVVLGTTVTVDALTRLEQESGSHTFSTLTFADFAVGNVVSVFGTRQTDGSILATRVEREDAAAPGEAEKRGTVSALDATAKTFTLGTTLVDYSGATVDGTLANGIKVEVEGALSGTTLMATRVHVEDAAEHELEDESELSGPISALDTTAKTFTLMGFKVDYSSAAVEGTLAEGVTVEVEGAPSATDATVLLATKVEVRFAHAGNGASDTKAEGAISAISATDLTLTVQGVTFWTDAQTLIGDDEAPLTFSQLAVGQRVEVRAQSTKTNAAGLAYATRIEQESK
jgi:hypothetical protein